jgi:cysteine-rich repeat protein
MTASGVPAARRRRVGVLFLVSAFVGVAAFLLPDGVTAQVASDTPRCVNAINKSMRKVTLAATKQVRSCVLAHAAGTLGSQTVAQCVAAGAGVQKAIQGALIVADNSCDGFPPAFGPPSISGHAARAVQLTQDLLVALFGATPESVLATNSAVMGCQTAVLKAAGKCEDLRINSFNKCKKEGLKRGFVTDAVDLQVACLGTGTIQPDPTGGKIDSTCVTVPAKKIESSCTSRGVALAPAFPGCGATTAAGLATCVDERLRCGFCTLLNDVDGLNRDCDLFDDANDANESCAEPAECGDADSEPGEACDDGGNVSGDGCSPTCEIEPGWTCSGDPSTCSPICGDGVVGGGEVCDDGDLSSSDGCSATCTVETGYDCVGSPSVCTAICGDGLLRPGEVCDDGGVAPGDGCGPTCTLEPGWTCGGQPSACSAICGDGLLRGTESCDDGDLAGGDGCDGTCQVEPGWTCGGQASTCATVCGDGLRRGTEACDDGGTTPGDGCSATCTIESGWQCSGQPTTCNSVCGDGLLRGAEACDDHNATSGDGCSAVCDVEQGYLCAGEPSVCTAVCGDGLLSGTEACDDENTGAGDGCSPTCVVEAGWACEDEPSDCETICGDGLLRGTEECDDSDTSLGDGCNGSCEVEPGYVCSGQPSTCVAFGVTISTPSHGIFTQSSSIGVTGFVSNLSPSQATLTINGTPVTIQPNGSFSTTVALSATTIFNPIRARVTETTHGSSVSSRVVVIRGLSIADGSLSTESIGLRFTDGGLDEVEPLVQQLAGAGLDLATLLPIGTVLVENECLVDCSPFGCCGSGTITVINPPASIGGFAIAVDSMSNFVAGDITVSDIRVNVFMDGSGVVPDCDIAIHADAAFFNGDYSLEPMASDPSNIDVNQLGDLDVSFTAFTASYGGACSFVEDFLPDIEERVVNAIRGFLTDPDGTGPLDSPTADAIESALAGISITGPVGQGLGVQLEAPLFAVTENNTGITFGSDSRFTVSVGSGPGQCQPPAGAPNLTASLAFNEVFPSFGNTTPVLGQPYDLAIAISSEGFNQLLRSQVECGLLVTSISTLDLGSGPVPITAGTLAALLPEFGSFPPATPFRIDVRPTLAPVLSGTAGPAGELALLKMSHLLITLVRNDASQQVVLQGAVDADIGLNLAFASGALVFDLSEPPAEDITVAVLVNPLGVNEAALEVDVLPPLVAALLPSVAGSLASFPLPEFFGLSLSGVEISRSGQFMILYANLQ